MDHLGSVKAFMMFGDLFWYISNSAVKKKKKSCYWAINVDKSATYTKWNNKLINNNGGYSTQFYLESIWPHDIPNHLINSVLECFSVPSTNIEKH